MEHDSLSLTSSDCSRSSNLLSESLPSGSGRGDSWKTWLKQYLPVSLLDFNTNAPKAKKAKGKMGPAKKAVKGKSKPTAKTKDKGKEKKSPTKKKKEKSGDKKGKKEKSGDKKGKKEESGDKKGKKGNRKAAQKKKTGIKKAKGGSTGTGTETEEEEKEGGEKTGTEGEGKETGREEEKKKDEEEKGTEGEETKSGEETSTETKDVKKEKGKRKSKKTGGKKGNSKGGKDTKDEEKKESQSESEGGFKKAVKFDAVVPEGKKGKPKKKGMNKRVKKDAGNKGKTGGAGWKAQRMRSSSVDSMESVSSTGRPVIEHLGNYRPDSTPRFYMREGSMDQGTITDFSDDSRQNISSSSSALSYFSPGTGEKSELSEIVSLHKKMLELQTKNYELTNAVAKAGAETAASVNLLLKSLPLIPTERGGLSKAQSEYAWAQAAGTAGPKPMEPKHVHVRVKFLRIIDIDTVGQQFDAEVYIEARWTEKKFHGYSMSKLKNVEFSECWDPHLIILNVVGELDIDKTSMVLRYEPDSVSPVLVYMWHVQGLFRERMELEHFPFDVQELSVVISSELSLDHIDLIEEPMFDSCVNLGALQESEEWNCYRHVEFVHDVMKREMESSYKHPVLVMSAHAKRKLGSYFWNVGIIVFLILALTFTLLSIDPTINDRLAIVMTLFLTAVAFKLIVRSSLPNISYLTYLDIYVVFCLVYLFLQGAESAFMLHLARFRDSSQVRSYDEIGQSCLIGFLIFFHLAFLIFIELTVLNRRRRMMRLDQDYQMKRLKRAKARQGVRDSVNTDET